MIVDARVQISFQPNEGLTAATYGGPPVAGEGHRTTEGHEDPSSSGTRRLWQAREKLCKYEILDSEMTTAGARL
jgi:hypothetical protein